MLPNGGEKVPESQLRTLGDEHGDCSMETGKRDFLPWMEGIEREVNRDRRFLEEF